MPQQTERWLSTYILNARLDVERARRALRKVSPQMRLLAERALKEAEVRCGYALHWIQST